jgi:hypothetical protein
LNETSPNRLVVQRRPAAAAPTSGVGGSSPSEGFKKALNVISPTMLLAGKQGLRDMLSIEEPIGPETISTMPEETIAPSRTTTGSSGGSGLIVGVDYDDVVATL